MSAKPRAKFKVAGKKRAAKPVAIKVAVEFNVTGEKTSEAQS